MTGKIGRGRKIAGLVMLGVTAWMIFSPTARAVRALPERLRLSIGQRWEMAGGAAAALSSGDERLSLEGGALCPQAAGEAEVTINLFGLFPIGRMRVDMGAERRLAPGGAAVGVALATRGVLVVGVSDVQGRSPAMTAGLRAGDILEQVNGQPVNSSQHLTELIAASGGQPLQISFLRDGARRAAALTPVKDASSGQYRVGAWVRDSTAGVGTLSYYNPSDGTYGALGHAINDGDTGRLLPIKNGALLSAQIVDVNKGKRGAPGELRGSFLRSPRVLGDLAENTALGVFGHLEAPYVNPLYPEGLPIAYQESVALGPASILSTVDEQGVKEYSVEIVQAARQLAPAQKSLVLRVTDPELLAKTGGIVQGMSGSPILQNGRIIGAVTHVFVDDPTQGYGVYIEWMLQTARAMDDAA